MKTPEQALTEWASDQIRFLPDLNQVTRFPSKASEGYTKEEFTKLCSIVRQSVFVARDLDTVATAWLDRLFEPKNMIRYETEQEAINVLLKEFGTVYRHSATRSDDLKTTFHVRAGITNC